MEIVISPVTNEEEEIAMLNVRREVFEIEMGVAVDCLRGFAQPHDRHLLARIGSERKVVAVLSVVDTSHDRQLHERYGLSFTSLARVARYTQLAVTRPYRGMGIPLMLTLDAHRRFVAPGQFDYTWLLYKAEQAAASSFCRLLGFVPSRETFQSEYGRSRLLLRDESAGDSIRAVSKAERYLQQLLRSYSLTVKSALDTCGPGREPTGFSSLSIW